MNRTGIVPELAYLLFETLIKDKLLEFQGLHVYDGHIRPLKLENRIKKCNSDFATVNQLIETIESNGGKRTKYNCGEDPQAFSLIH